MQPNEVLPTERAGVMKELYHEAEDPILYRIPTPLGNELNINCFVDSNHAGNCSIRCLHSGFMIYVNMAPIIWFSKKQNTVESSTFSAELVALKIAIELIESLRYKL